MKKKERSLVDFLKSHDEVFPPLREKKGLIPSVEEKKRYRKKLVGQYHDLAEFYVKERKLEGSSLLLELVSDFAELSFTAKEILAIHTDVMDQMTHGLQPLDVRKIVDRSRFLLLGVMIHLVEFYRERK